jgi:hypothetical protein
MHYPPLALKVGFTNWEMVCELGNGAEQAIRKVIS